MFSLPHHATPITALTMMSASWAWIACTGVLYFGLTYPNHLGSASARAIEYAMRVATVFEAMQTASVELTSASRTTQYRLPQYWSARISGGRFGASAIADTRSVPQPRSRNHVQMDRKSPAPTTEMRSARGTFRLGFWLSSAIGAEPSQPVIEKMPKTTPR